MDRRITPARNDLAADWLRDHVNAGQYVSGAPRMVVYDGAPLHFVPDRNSRLESQLIYGEVFQVYEDRNGWCWGQNLKDSYVGYVPTSHLSSDLTTSDHQVVALRCHLYVEPNLKRPTAGTISISARVKVVDVFGSFSRISTGPWVHSRHLVCLTNGAQNIVGTALKFIGVPYLWGGRSAEGVDCSSLVQIALAMAGVSAPRDSDLQESAVGVEVPMDSREDYSRIKEGDFVFFPGHVGIFIDDWRFLHANAFDMQVSLHGFSDVLDRARSENCGVTSIRRLTTSTRSSHRV